jgi:HAD superfamily hydrolase (TIGR01509 family)
MKKCIIFDMDGVLVNTEPVHYKLWRKVFNEFGFDVEYDIYKGCIGSTNSFLMNLLYENCNVDYRNDPSLTNRFKEVKNKWIREEGIPAIPGAADTIRKLYEKGYRMAVASSSPQMYIDICIKNLGIESCFELLFTGENVPNPKPAPDVFLAVAEQMGMNPENCIVVEDSRNGSLAAKAAGMFCLGFANPDSGNQDLSAADRTFYPFDQLLKELS